MKPVPMTPGVSWNQHPKHVTGVDAGWNLHIRLSKEDDVLWRDHPGRVPDPFVDGDGYKLRRVGAGARIHFHDYRRTTTEHKGRERQTFYYPDPELALV